MHFIINNYFPLNFKKHKLGANINSHNSAKIIILYYKKNNKWKKRNKKHIPISLDLNSWMKFL